MSTWTALGIHLFATLMLGWVAARLAGARPTPVELLPGALLAGFYLETMFAAAMLFLGVPLSTVVWILLVGTLIAFAVWAMQKENRHLDLSRPRWYECGLAALLAEKFVFAAWAAETAPIIFDDALRAWGGRGRALFGAWNFSFDALSPAFLGYTGPREYPLAKPIYNAITAMMAGEWTDALARTDTLVFMPLLAGAVWSAVYGFSRNRALSCAAGFTVAVLPFVFWQGVSGYGDITVAAMAAASAGFILRRDFFLAGLLAAGTAWAKNDGLFLFMPPLLLCALIASGLPGALLRLKRPGPEAWKRTAGFLAGLATLAPWAVFKGLSVTHQGATLLHDAQLFLEGHRVLEWTGLGLAALVAAGAVLVYRKTPASVRRWTGRAVLALGGVLCLFLAWHFASYAAIYAGRMDLHFRPAAFPALADVVLTGPTHSLFWIFVTASMALGLPWTLRSRQGTALLALFLSWAALFLFLFSCTTAFDWLSNQTTVHRSALQAYGIGTIAAFHGIWSAMAGLSQAGAASEAAHSSGSTGEARASE